VSASYVTVAELRSNLGIGTLYSDATLEEVCQTAEDLLNQYLWVNSIPVIGAVVANNVATFVLASDGSFTTGQTVTISNCGPYYNGQKTITATYPWSTGSGSFPIFNFYFPYTSLNFPRGYSLIQTAITHEDENYHLIVPYGKVTGPNLQTTAYSATPAIREAAMILAVDVWQARQVSQTGGISPDFSPSPYRMGNTLMARVRGLISPYLGPRSMVG